MELDSFCHFVRASETALDRFSSQSFLSPFLFIFDKCFVSISVHHVHAGAHTGQKQVSDSPGTVVARGCELPHVLVLGIKHVSSENAASPLGP